MNDRNWNQLLLATLKRARGHMPGEAGLVWTSADKAAMGTVELRQLDLGQDIDDILEDARDRDEL